MDLWERLKNARERIDAAQEKMLALYDAPSFPPIPDAFPPLPIECYPTPVWLLALVRQAENQAALAEGLLKLAPLMSKDGEAIGGVCLTPEEVKNA